MFASEGLAVWDKEMRKEAKCEYPSEVSRVLTTKLSLRDALVPIWANPRDGEEVDERMVKIKADLLSELAAVCTPYQRTVLLVSNLNVCVN